MTLKDKIFNVGCLRVLFWVPFYIPLSFELCMYSLWNYKISTTKSVYFPKKAQKIMNFLPFNAHTTPLFENCNILRFGDISNVESCIFINNCFNKDSFSIFNENFKLVSTTHSYNTRSARNGLLFVPSYNSQIWEKINYPFNHSYMELSSRQVN